MKRTTRFGLLIALAGGSLVVVPPLAEAYSLPKLGFLAAGAALAWAGLAGASVRRTSLDLPIAALWIVMLASAATSVDPAASLLGMYPQQYYGLFPLALCTALFYASASADDSDETAVKILVATAALISVFGIVQRIADRPLLSPEALPSGHRITSTIGNPVMLGALLALCFPLALRDALEKKSHIGRAAAVLIPVALALTWARASWASAAFAAAVYALLSGRVKLRGGDARKLGLACALAAAPAFLFLQRGLAKGDSDSMRVEMIKASIPMLKTYPALGWGPDTYMIPFRRFKTDRWINLSHTTAVLQLSAHDDLLQAAVTLGLAGLAAYLWLLGGLFAAFRRRLAERPGDGLTAAAAAGLAGLFLQAKVNPVTPSVIAAACVLAGMASRRAHPLPRAKGRAVAGLASASMVAAAALVGRLVYADRLYRRGIETMNSSKGIDATFMAGVGDLKRSTELDPWNANYLSQRCEVIFRVSRITPRDQGKQLIDKTLELTAAGIRMHPGNPTAHELRSTALTLAARFGADTLKEARSEIELASQMDPTLTFTLRRRMDLARMMNDREEFERVKAQYLRVIVLTMEPPDWNPIVL